MKIVRFIISAFLLSPFSPFIKNAWPIESEANLVGIFCEKMVIEDQGELKSLVSNDKEWKTFTQVLESKEYSSTSSRDKLESSAFQQCVSNYGADFETAEFILKGKKFVEKSVKDLEEKHSTNPMVSTAAMYGELELPLVGNIVLENQPKTGGSATEEAGLGIKKRQKQYKELWINFLANLRQKLDSHRDTL